MSDFLVLHKTGPNPGDLEVVDVILGKKDDEGEKAIEEALTKGEGQYIALPFDEDKIVKRKAQQTLSLSEVTAEDEAQEAQQATKGVPASPAAEQV
jgi:preprotein translocase subunit SecD